MVAFGHTTAFLLAAAFLVSCTTAAPATSVEEGDNAQTQALDYPNEAGASRCYYNFQHYEEGDRIVTNEPCLNCTCHKRMLMCYLRVCPFTKAVGQDCTVEKRPDQCCPVITCPQVPVDILTSSTTTEATASTAVGHPNTYGCTLEDNTFYPDGVQMPSDLKTPCELCYCIRNHTACVRQECTLNVEGCRPIYQEGVCCPVRYDCEYNELTTTERPSTGGLLLSSTASPMQCQFGETLYNDGELIESDKPCESCYCMRGEIVCAVRTCGEPMAGKDCEAMPPPEGECCPTVYQCANGTIPVDALSTESAIIMHPADIQTQSPPKESEPEQPVVEDTKTEDSISTSEVTTGAPKVDDKEQENIENDKPVEVEEHESRPENVESDPLDTDEPEEDEVMGGIIPVDDAKPDKTNTATEVPTDHTAAPVKETEIDSQYEKETVTTGPIEVEYEGSTELHSKPELESSESGVVAHDPETTAVQHVDSEQTSVLHVDPDQTPEQHVDPELIQDGQEVDSTAATEIANVEDQSPTQTVSTSESEIKVEQPEPNPLETETSIPHVIKDAVPDSEPEASHNTDAKPVEGASDDGEVLELELKPQEDVSSTPVIENVQEETAPNVPKLPESLDQKKDDDLSSPTNNIVPADDSGSNEHDHLEVKPDSSDESEPSKSEVGETSEEIPKPYMEIESEGEQKEPVPPRKGDAIPEEPRPTQHAEGSMTKAEDSVPTDLSQTHSESGVPDKAADINNTHNNESPSDADVQPTESLHAETPSPTKEEEVQSPASDVSFDNNESPLETPENPTFGDDVESESSTDKVKQPNQPTKAEESASSEGEIVPNVVVTETDVDTSEGSGNDEAETPVSESTQDGAVVEEASLVETETSVTDNKPEDNVVPVESEDGDKPVEPTNEKHEDESKESETSNVSNDETVVTLDNESSTKENEIVEQPEENSVPAKEQVPSTDEELSQSTEKYIPAETEQDQTEMNEIISEPSDAQPDEKMPVKESNTELAPSEESSTDTLVKLGNEDKPEDTVNEEEINESSDSKPAESQPAESENEPHHDNPELNVFQDDIQDPESDPTDFDEQLEDSDNHIHNQVTSENEIVDDHQPGHGGSLDHKHPVNLPGPIGVIPGEGDCLVDGKTYTNNSEIPSRSPCHKLCTCMSSIVHCQGIDCPPPPPQLANCMPVHQGDLCCPVYTCDGNTPESPETDNQVVATDKTPEPVVPEEKPVPSGESEMATEKPHEVVTKQPQEIVTEQTNELVSEQPHEVESENPHEVASEKPHEVASEQPHEVASDLSHEVASELPHEVASELPLEVASEQPQEVASDLSHEVASELPHEVASELPLEVASEQPQEVASEQPHEVASEQPELPVSVTDNKAQDMPVEAPEQTVEGSEQHTEESSQPEANEAISSEQDPTTAETETSTDAVETSQSSTEGSHKEGSISEPSGDKDSLLLDNEEQKPTEVNTETEVQTASPVDSVVVADEKLETKPESDSNDLPSEGSVESQPEILTDDVENQEGEHNYPLSTDPPAVQEELPSKPEEENIIPEPEGDSNAEQGGEHTTDVTETPAVPAADVVNQSSTEVGEDQITATDPSTEKPTGVDSASSVFEQVPSTEKDSEDDKHPVEEPVKETIEPHDIPSQTSADVQEKPNDESALEDGSTQEEVDHDIVVQEIDSHNEGGSLNEENLPKHPEESVLGVTNQPIEDNASSKPDNTDSNLINQQPQSQGTEPVSIDEVVEDETATAIQEAAEVISIAEGSNESIKESGAEVASTETNNESPSVTASIIESEESQTNLPSVFEDDTHLDESSVLQGLDNAVTNVYQEGEVHEPGTEPSHKPEESETVPIEDSQHEGSETGNSVEESKPETSGTVLSDIDSTETPVVAPVSTENDDSEEPIALSEVHSDSSVESETVPSSELASSEVQLNTTVPESEEEQVTTVVYKDHEESLSEPIDEHQETSPEENSGTISSITENEEHPAQLEVLVNEGHLEQEDLELTVTEPANLNEETEEHSEATSDSSHQSEKEHEVEQPSVGITPQQVSDTENTVVTEKDSEQTVKPEPVGQSSEGEENVHTEEISEPVHEDTKLELEEDHKEPISHGEVPSGSEEQTHQEDEHSTQSEVEPQKPVEHPSQEPENHIQESEHSTHEAELQESILPHLPAEEGDGDSKPSLPVDPDIPTEDQFPTGAGDMDYDVNEDGAFGPGTCRYGGKVYVSAQQIPRDDPCDFCFCFRSDIICLQQSCPPPIHRCHQEPIQGYCCPRYQCPVSMATSLNLTTTTTTTTTTLPPHFFAHAYQGAARQSGCLHRGRAYSVGEEITSASGPCLQCICGSDGQMKCDPVVCSPEPMLRKMMEAAVSHRRR